MPLDVMVPYWGDPALMRATVESVLAQVNPDWRLTVVDDAYPDPAIAEYMAAIDDPRVTYVRKEINEGITENYRTCLQLATQEIMTFVGSDDVLLPNYVDTILSAHRQFPQADIIQPGVRVIDEHGIVSFSLADMVKRRISAPGLRKPRLLKGESLAASLLGANWLYWPSLTFRRERLLVTPFRDGFPLVQDLALIVDIACAGGQLLTVPDVCFSYRRHSASASSSTLLDGRRFRGEREYFRLASQQVTDLGWRRARRAARRHWASRLYALSLLPVAVRDPDATVSELLSHALRPLGSAEPSA